LGGGSVDHRKISWFDWQSIYRSQEVGGLGVRRIKDFNIALLGKWCWRLLVDSDSLWCRVLSAHYGVEDDRVREGGREASSWWRDVSAIRSEEWFHANISQVVGDGKNTLFWSDAWVGGVSFRGRLTDNANVPVDIAVPASSLWHKDVPLKVVLFVWSLFRDRLPTKDNLFCRHVIAFDAQSCVGGCGEVETSSHLFFHCNLFGSVWNHILRWLGLSAVWPYDVANHYYQFSYIGGVAKSRRSILQVIWFATV